MYRIKEIQDALLHLVGWKQAYNPALNIDDRMTQSESGLNFQEAHPLVTLDNVKAIMPDDWGYQYPDWEQKEYLIGDKVKTGVFPNFQLWVALTNNNTQPTQGNSDWRPYNMLSDYLEDLTRSGITKAIQTFIQTKVLAEQTKNLLEKRTFFDGSGRLQATITNMNKIVGFELSPVKSMGVTAKINRIGLQMTGGTGIVRVYLFHSSKVEPVKAFDLNYTLLNGGFQWFDIQDCYLPNLGKDTNAGGDWFLCYNQSDLPNGMESINVTKDWSVEPCGSCNIGNIENWRELMKYFDISPFMVSAPTTFEEIPELWNMQRISYTSTQNYGMNVEISVGCDLTDFIISQRSIFQTVIQRQVAAIALRTMAMNPDVKVNRNQSNVSKMDILYELDGNTAGVRPNGLGYDLKKAIDSLDLDTKGIDRICLGCSKGGVRYRTV